MAGELSPMPRETDAPMCNEPCAETRSASTRFSASFNLARRSPPSSIASQGALVTIRRGEPFSIQPFQQRTMTRRESERLAQLAHSCGSVFGNEFGHL